MKSIPSEVQAELESTFGDHVRFDELERLFRQVLPQAPQADIVPKEFEDYFAELRRRTRKLRREKRRRREQE